MKHRKPKGKHRSARRHFERKNSNNFLLTRDFSSVEDAPNSFEIIRDIVYRAGKNAAAEAKAAGLPYTFARENQVIRRQQNGQEEIIETSENSPVNSTSYFVYYKPFTILHARKK